MSEVRAVGFVFTSPDTVAFIGRGWKDAKGRRYRMHVFPSVQKDKELELVDNRPNAVILKRADKAHALDSYAPNLHRILFFGPPDELRAFNIPLVDTTKDEKGKLIPLPRCTNADFNLWVEQNAVAVNLTPSEKKVQSTLLKKKELGGKNGEGEKKVLLPKTLSGFLDEIELDMSDSGDEWEDLEKPVLHFLLGRTYQEDFEQSCKNLARLGVNKKLCRSYFRWVAIRESGLNLSATFEVVARSLEEGASINLRSLAKKSGVNLDDLSVLYNMYKAELEEEKE